MRTRFSAVLLATCCCLAAIAAEDGTGLAATYYDNMDFTGTSVSRIDPLIKFTWNPSTPAPGVIGPEYWSAIWVGSIAVPTTGTYTFTTVSDDGVVLLIDGTPVIENWTGHSSTTDTGMIALTTGLHAVELRYYNSHGGATLTLSWQGPGVAKAIIPTAALYPTVPPAVIGTGTGLLARYTSTGNWSGSALTRTDPAINFRWGKEAPMAGVRQDLFSVEWRGWLQAQYTQVYTFTAESDDGFALWLDGKPIIDALTYTPTGELTGKLYLVGGRRYEIVARHRQVLGDAKAVLSWSCPLTPRQVIPTSQMYPYEVGAANAVAITTAAETWTSPAWIEGTRGSAAASITATVNGSVVPSVASAASSWYLAADPAQRKAPGVPLRPGANVVEVTSTVAGVASRATQELVWQTLVMGNLPYGLDRLVVRVADRVRVSATGPATVRRIDATGTVCDTWDVARDQAIEIGFPTAGRFKLTAVRDGAVIGSLPVTVVDVDFRGPIACEIDFQRTKDVTAVAAESGDLWFAANDVGLLDVGQGTVTGTTQRVALRPHAFGDLAVYARILGGDGPLVAWCPLDEFTQRTSAESTITIVGTLPDGSLLTQARLTMTPLVPGLDVRLSMYTGGTTFPDGTTQMWVPTSLYTPSGATGVYDYQIIRSPRSGSALCHSTQTYQDGVLVGNH